MAAALSAGLPRSAWLLLPAAPARGASGMGRRLPSRLTLAAEASNSPSVGAPVPARPFEVGGMCACETTIRLRSGPSLDSAPTGLVAKAGEMFEASEVVQGDGVTYLRVGNRGWVFDVGLSGEWAGKSIVHRVPEKSEGIMRTILRDPKEYAEYRKIMDSPNYLEMGQQYQERAIDPAIIQTLLDAGEDPANLADMFGGVYGADPEKKQQLEQQLKDVIAGLNQPGMDEAQIAALLGVEEEAMDLETDGDFEPKHSPPIRPNMQDPYKVHTIVAPKWLKLQGKEMQEHMNEEGGDKKPPPMIRDLPRGPEANRNRPSATGSRFGFRSSRARRCKNT